MLFIMSTTQTIIFLTFIQSVLTLQLEKLFKEKISDAKCFAKCQEAPTQEDRSQCFVICKILQENPGTDLCSLNEVCLGGCQLACDKTQGIIQEIPRRFEKVVLDDCELSWNLDGNGHVVFLIAGKDQGNMWNLMFNKLSSSKVNLNPQMASKFTKVQIFAINRKHVMDKIELSLLGNTCHESVPQPKEFSIPTEGEGSINLAGIIILSSVAVFSVVFITAILYFRIWWVHKTKSALESAPYTAPSTNSYTYSPPVRNLEATSVFINQDYSNSSNEYEEIEINNTEELEYIDPFIS